MGMINIEIERSKAGMLLEVLVQRLEIIQEIEKRGAPRDVSIAVAREKEAVLPAVMALEAALRTPRS